MKTFIVIRTDEVCSEFEVEAETKEEAIEMVADGDINSYKEETVSRDFSIKN